MLHIIYRFYIIILQSDYMSLVAKVIIHLRELGKLYIIINTSYHSFINDIMIIYIKDETIVRILTGVENIYR